MDGGVGVGLVTVLKRYVYVSPCVLSPSVISHAFLSKHCNGSVKALSREASTHIYTPVIFRFACFPT